MYQENTVIPKKETRVYQLKKGDNFYSPFHKQTFIFEFKRRNIYYATRQPKNYLRVFHKNTLVELLNYED